MKAIPRPLLESAKRVAAESALPELGDAVASAIDLAVQLLVHGVDSPTVVRVAALDPGATRSDALPVIREMLDEHGLGIPDRLDANGRCQLLRHGVGFWDIPIATFEGPFYERIPAWDAQGVADRALVQLLDQRERVTTAADRPAIDARIRAAARYAEDDAVVRQIEAAVADQDPSRPVRIPGDLAEAARAAWLRDEIGPIADELGEERLLRDRAGTLALIGLAVAERGVVDGEHVVVALAQYGGESVSDGREAQLERGEFVTADRLTLVSRIGWLDLDPAVFVQTGERYRADWAARTVIVERLDGSTTTHASKPSGPDSPR